MRYKVIDLGIMLQWGKVQMGQNSYLGDSPLEAGLNYVRSRGWILVTIHEKQAVLVRDPEWRPNPDGTGELFAPI